MLRPTGYLTFELDSATGNADRAASLSRAFSYVSPVTVQPGQTNRILLTVKLSGHTFWDVDDAEQQTIWEEVVAPWLSIRLKKIQETLQEYNNAETKSYCGAVIFDDAIIQLDGRTVQCAIIDDQLAFMTDLVDKLRHAEEDMPEGTVMIAPAPTSAATFERRTDETTATMTRPPEPELEPELASGEAAADEQAAADATNAADSALDANTLAKPAFKPRRLTIKERDALRRDPFALITDYEITIPDGETQIFPLL